MFNREDFKLDNTPLATEFKLRTNLCPCDENEKEEMSRVPYAIVI